MASSDSSMTTDADSFAGFFNQQVNTPQEPPPAPPVVEAMPDDVMPQTEVPDAPPVSEEPRTTESAPKPDKQVFYVKDSVTGVREKQEIDWTKREDIIKEVSKARGVLPKLQSQRDQLKAKLEDVEPKYLELQTELEKMKQAYSGEGALGVLNYLAQGDEDELSAMLDSIYEERIASVTATAEEKREREHAKLRKQQDDEATKMKQELESLRTNAQKEAETTRARQEEAELNRVGSKWEFKLGDSTLQEELNDMLWDRATAQMDRLAKQGIEITAAVKEAQFRLAKQSLNKFANAGAKEKGKQAVETAKSRAASQIAAQASGASGSQMQDAKMKEAAGANSGFAAFFNAVRGK